MTAALPSTKTSGKACMLDGFFAARSSTLFLRKHAGLADLCGPEANKNSPGRVRKNAETPETHQRMQHTI